MFVVNLGRGRISTVSYYRLFHAYSKKRGGLGYDERSRERGFEGELAHGMKQTKMSPEISRQAMAIEYASNIGANS